MLVRRMVAVLAVGVLTLPGTPCWPQDADSDGIPDAVEARLGTRRGRADALTLLFEDPDEPEAGGADQALDFTRVWAGHVGRDRWVWKIETTGEAEPAGCTVILYVDADDNPDTGRQDKPEVIGTDIMYAFREFSGSESLHNPTVSSSRPDRARYVFAEGALFISDDVVLAGDGAATRLRFRLLSQRPDSGDSMPFVAASVPRVAADDLPEVLPPGGLDWRGLPGSQIRVSEPVLPFPRPRPAVPYRTSGTARGEGTAERTRVGVELLEEAGLPRPAARISFGFPFEQGAVFRPEQVRVMDGETPVPADIAVTGLWPDGSLRWVSVDTPVALEPGEKRELTVEYGRSVRRPAPQPIAVQQDAGSIRVDTGSVTTRIGLDPLVIEELTLAAPADGNGAPVRCGATFRLVAPDGQACQLREAEARIEYAGARKVVIRCEAPYRRGDDGRTWFRGIVRFVFRAGSPVVEVWHTLVNDNLEWEFSDLRELTFRLDSPREGRTAPPSFTVGAGPEAPVWHTSPSPAPSLFVPDDSAYVLDGERRLGRTIGAVQASGPGGAGVCLAVLDFWQRYPKGIAVTDKELVLHLLPAYGDSPGAAFPTPDLPGHLSFPYVDSHYRLKWGMSTTDRFFLVPYPPNGADHAAGAALDAIHPVVAVIPAAHYERSKALGELAAADGELFSGWDQAFAAAFERHLRLKEEKREYGFLNWGDWHGERGHNWGNNEYDLPHALFMQFARTGRRAYCRLALAGARHQADVDCIHAYPDLFYVGGNVLHSYAHTGEWSQHVKRRQWSFPYGYHAAAWNGHTWADGMVDAWYLAGDPRVMEAAIGLGEHIAWQMSRRFERLGTHERSAGWSAHAIAAIYRATLDPEYLTALERILEVAFREQKTEDTGAWPHPLPSDHAGGVKGARGNGCFLIGILLEGIEDYWELTGDERAEDSIRAAVGWLRSMWLADREVFPYTSSPAFIRSATRQGSSSNNLILGPILRAAEWTGDDALLEIGVRGFTNAVRYGLHGFGKSFAQASHFAPQVMARIKHLDGTSKPYGRGLLLSAEELRRQDLVAAGPPKSLGLRGPKEKRVFFRHDGGGTTFTASRAPWGARAKVDERGTLRLVAPDGAVLKERTFSTDASAWSFEAELPATAPQGIYRVEISDDMRARWDVTGPPRRVVRNGPPVQFGGPGVARWYLGVPGGTKAFTAAVTSHHGGRRGLIVCAPDGRPVADLHEETGGRTSSLRIRVPPGQAGKVWSVVVYARLDLSLVLEGLPPFLSTSPEGWFDPGESDVER